MDVVRGSLWGRSEGDGAIYFPNAIKVSMEQGDRTDKAHEQIGQILGMSLEILVSAANASGV